ncbi:unnamed protein product [Cyclocybe aegerita]|uniref:BTB domain-containing protein n=1 Tax=Cyclocybe aegerita TaxID=1973307 RepID=A0A8S0XF24_CYCAE|nr:unnamed protein product [Cyclocybe aegerita]
MWPTVTKQSDASLSRSRSLEKLRNTRLMDMALNNGVLKRASFAPFLPQRPTSRPLPHFTHSQYPMSDIPAWASVGVIEEESAIGIPDAPNAPAPASPGPSTACANLPVVRRDKEYYFQNVVFQVGSVLFNVPKQGFQVPGTIFEAMFSLPTGMDLSEVEGSSDERPIVLGNIPTNHFRSFLKALYPFNEIKLSYDDWVGVLALSTMWYFQETRQRAISALTPLVAEKPLPEAITLAKKYRVQSWLRDSYTRFINRPDVLTIQDFAPLDWETTAKLFCARDTAARTGLTQNFYCNTCNVWTGPSYSGNNERCHCRRKELVEKLFGDEFSAMIISDDSIDSSKTSSKKGKKKKN